MDPIAHAVQTAMKCTHLHGTVLLFQFWPFVQPPHTEPKRPLDSLFRAGGSVYEVSYCTHDPVNICFGYSKELFQNDDSFDET